MEYFLEDTKPDLLIHLAALIHPSDKNKDSMAINCDWPAKLADLARVLSIKFLFTSTVMVYDGNTTGPYYPVTKPSASSGYGHEKLMAEELIRRVNPNAIIARLGWQIDEKTGSNSMVDFIAKEIRQMGHIKANVNWLPACSFLPDTIFSIVSLINNTPGIYLLDSNRRWSFYEICIALAKHLNLNWHIQMDSGIHHDQRMIDTRVNMPSLEKRLILLKA
jgi:dTDP-4-dehydrorhamnose reductase